MRQHRSLTADRRMLLRVIAVVALVALIGAGCTANDTPEQGTVQLEPVAYTGANPFTPPVGTDQSGRDPTAAGRRHVPRRHGRVVRR